MRPSTHSNRELPSHRLVSIRGQATSRLQTVPRWLVSLLLCCWSLPRQQSGLLGVRAQSAGTADDSVVTTDDAAGLALCQQLWIASDANGDGQISRSEYINWVVNYSPYSPTCPNRAYISQFLGYAPLAMAFESLACLCQSYGVNASCCDDPRLELPNFASFPSSYATTVCRTIDRVLDEQCNNATSVVTTTSNATTTNGANATSTNADSNNGTSASAEEDPTSPNMTNPIVFGDGSDEGASGGKSATATPSAPESDSQQQLMMVQLVLPLLLVAAAAVFMGVTVVLYQRRKHASSAAAASFPDSSSGGGSSSAWNYRLWRKKVAAAHSDRGDPTDVADASSTDSDEEAVAGDDVLVEDRGSSRSSTRGARTARRRGGDRDSTLIDIDTGAPVARRSAAQPMDPASKAARRSARRRHKAQISSLLDSVVRLEPLREVEEGDDGDDGTASRRSDRAVVADALSTPSLLKSKVSFCDDDDDDDEDDSDEQDGDEEGHDEERPRDGVAVDVAPAQPSIISTLLQDLWGQRGSHDPPSSRDDNDKSAGAAVHDRRDADVESNLEPSSDSDAQGTATTTATATTATSDFQRSDMVQPKEDKVVVVQLPDAVIRRTKDKDESFDEVSL